MSNSAPFEIEIFETEDELTEFLLFADRVYGSYRARWPVIIPYLLPALLGEGPFAKGRRTKAFAARKDGQIVARAVGVTDERYLGRWHEPMGFVNLFEALPSARDEAIAVLNEACGWLKDEGMESARCGFGAGELPLVIDEYESLPPIQVRQNPPQYHCFLKEARFLPEKGWVDYKIQVSPELIRRWNEMLEESRSRGFEIVPLKDLTSDAIPAFTTTWNDAFYNHWANTPFIEEEFTQIFEMLGPMGAAETSLIGYEKGEPLGVLWVTPEMSPFAIVREDYELTDAEKLNFLGIGVREQARGRGLNLGMAAYSYLELVRRGAKYLSYTMVVDDNWPSRRTAEKLGAHVCANYVVYRRELSASLSS